MLDEIADLTRIFFLYCEDTDLGSARPLGPDGSACTSLQPFSLSLLSLGRRAGRMKAYYVGAKPAVSLVKNFPART